MNIYKVRILTEVQVDSQPPSFEYIPQHYLVTASTKERAGEAAENSLDNNQKLSNIILTGEA